MRKLFTLLSFAFTATYANAIPIKKTVYPATSTGYIKVYVQPSAASATDILFLIDNSGSMGPHQSNFAANIPTLAQAIADRGISTNAAVLTMDMERFGESVDQGKFRAILKSSATNFKRDLEAALKVGTTGGGYERPFDAVKAALSTPLIDRENAGFLRPEAPLVIITVTDAEDQSTMSAVDFKQFLVDLKGQAGVSMYSFMSPQSEVNCAKDFPIQPDKLESLTKEMGGEVFSLCSPDWHAPMISIADKMLKEITRTIVLPTTPIVHTLEVRYGSQRLIGGDLLRGWVYDEKSNSIVIGELFDFTGQDSSTELEIKFVPQYWK